jgi:hypothetical protein
VSIRKPARTSLPPAGRLCAALLAALVTLPAAAAHPAICDKWQPGHYLRVPVYQDEGLLDNVLSRDLSHFKGILYHFEWGALEREQGQYDFSRIDEAVDAVARHGKYILFMMADRTFGGGCDSGFLPDYVHRADSPLKEGFCTAAVWEPETMDHRIRVLTALLGRYADHSRVLGVVLPETALAIRPHTTPGFTWQGYKEQLRRSYRAIHAAVPNMLIIQGFNFPQEKHRPGFMSDLRQALEDLGEGGGISWPDTVPERFKEWDQYRMARTHNRRLAIVPQVQTPNIRATDTEAIYQYLVEDVGAQMIIWSHWHRDMSDYLGSEVIATVNRHNGFIRNSACIFAGHHGGRALQ